MCQEVVAMPLKAINQNVGSTQTELLCDGFDKN